MRVFLQAVDEHVCTYIMQFLQVQSDKITPADVYRSSKLYLSTIKDNGAPLKYGKIVSVNEKGVTMELKDSKTSYLSFVPWEAVHEFKVSTREPLYA